MHSFKSMEETPQNGESPPRTPWNYRFYFKIQLIAIEYYTPPKDRISKDVDLIFSWILFLLYHYLKPGKGAEKGEKRGWGCCRRCWAEKINHEIKKLDCYYRFILQYRTVSFTLNGVSNVGYFISDIN